MHPSKLFHKYGVDRVDTEDLVAIFVQDRHTRFENVLYLKMLYHNKQLVLYRKVPNLATVIVPLYVYYKIALLERFRWMAI